MGLSATCTTSKKNVERLWFCSCDLLWIVSLVHFKTKLKIFRCLLFKDLILYKQVQEEPCGATTAKLLVAYSGRTQAIMTENGVDRLSSCNITLQVRQPTYFIREARPSATDNLYKLLQVVCKYLPSVLLLLLISSGQLQLRRIFFFQAGLYLLVTGLPVRASRQPFLSK